jgi:hypothetical protein
VARIPRHGEAHATASPPPKADLATDFGCFTPNSGRGSARAVRGNFDPKRSSHKSWAGPGEARGQDLHRLRVERGFDFLGYHFGPEGLSVAKKTIEQFVERALRLYEQEPGELGGSSRLGSYVRRWVGWVVAESTKGLTHPKPGPVRAPSLALSPTMTTTAVTIGQL